MSPSCSESWELPITTPGGVALILTVNEKGRSRGHPQRQELSKLRGQVAEAINNEQKSQWFYLGKSSLRGVRLPTLPLRSLLVWAEFIVTCIRTGLISLPSAEEERLIQKEECYIKAGIWHFCSHFLIIIFKVTWVLKFPNVGTISQNNKTKNHPS